MQRYFVCRAYLKWKGKMYYKGDLLPENFTHHDKARSIYNSRIGKCEVPDEKVNPVSTPASTPVGTPLTGQPAVSPSSAPVSNTTQQNNVQQGVNSADGTPKFNFGAPITGASK